MESEETKEKPTRGEVREKLISDEPFEEAPPEKILKEGFDLALIGEKNLNLVSELLPNGLEIVKYDGILWLKIPPREKQNL